MGHLNIYWAEGGPVSGRQIPGPWGKSPAALSAPWL